MWSYQVERRPSTKLIGRDFIIIYFREAKQYTPKIGIPVLRINYDLITDICFNRDRYKRIHSHGGTSLTECSRAMLEKSCVLDLIQPRGR